MADQTTDPTVAPNTNLTTAVNPTAPSLPRFIQQQGNGTVYDTAGGFLDPIASPTDFQSRSGSSDIAGNTTVVPDVNKYLTDYFNQVAQARYQPQEQQALDQIGLSGQQLNQNEAQVNQDFSNADQTSAENQNNLGLLSSGSTAALQAKSGVDKASSLASIALQRAGLATQSAQVKTTGQQSINDYVNQLLSGSTQAQQASVAQQLQLQDLAAKTPIGQSVTIGGKTVQGTMQPSYTTLDLGNKIALVDQGGNIVQSYAKGAAPTSGGSSLSTAADKNSALTQAVQAAIASGQYTATGAPGKMSREQLIATLSGQFAGSGITAQDIKDAVYGNFVAQGEPAYNPVAQTAAQSATSQQVQTNIKVAQEALQAVQNASKNLNTAPDKASAAYLEQSTRNAANSARGNNSDITTLQSKGEALLTAIRALTNTGRVTESEINAVQLPTIYDTSTEAQQKIQLLQNLLQTAAGSNSSSSTQVGPPAPVTSGKLSSGLTFTVTK